MQTPGANKRGNTFVYVAMCLLVSASSSVFNPVLSYFLNTELHFDPIHISIFFILLPIATIVIVQTIARFSDMGLQRPAIICIACLFGIASAGLLYMRPNFIVMCTLGLLVLGSYPVAFPQIFASAREYAVKYVHGSIMFTTFLRSLASLSWVIGPPLAYTIAMGYSFNMLFIVTACMFTVCCVTCFFFLPNVLEKSSADKSQHIKWWTNKSVMILFVAYACMFTAFSSYIVSMPLYITKELQLGEKLPGIMMGLAAGLEIPLMFLAARIAKAIGLKTVVIIGALALLVFLFLFARVTTKTEILCLQILSASYIAFVAAMGMVLFQELLPQIPGQATSLYINASTAGQIAGGALISIASAGTYSTIFLVGGCIAAFGIFLLFFVKKPPRVS